MASKFSFTQIIKKGDAKQRILLIVGVLVVLLFLFYFLSKLINFDSNATGGSRVSGVPSISSVQGGKVSPEYARALESDNTQKVDYANSTGTSAIPTLINTGVNDIVPVQTGCTSCCNTCGNESTDQMLSTLLSSGKISSSTADLLNKLAGQNLSPDDYEAALERMVREGKISPEEARRLLAAYKANYKSKIAAAGAADLDPLIKQGVLSVGAASDLLDLQKQPASLSTYEQALAKMVSQGQLTPEAASLLLQKYQQQQAKRQAAEAAGQLDSMVANGTISSETAATLRALQGSGMSPSDYASALDKLVAAGKLSPEDAKRLLAEYNKQHGIENNAAVVSGMELSKEQGDALKAIQQANQPVAVFAAKLEEYARSGQISANTASQLLNKYQAEYNAKQSGDATRSKAAADSKDQLIATLQAKPKLPSDAAQTLANLRNSSASLSDYAAELQRMVDAGLISPETAQALLAAYKQQLAQSGFATNGNGASFAGLSSPAIDLGLSKSSGNAKLDRVAQLGLAQQSSQTQQRKDYTAAAAFQQQTQQAAALEQSQIQQLSTQMYAQAQQLIGSTLTPSVQTVVTGSATDAGAAGAGGISAGGSGAQNGEAGIPIIKAGAIMYGVLDTAVDSDYPDSPLMATLVSGPYKGAKLLGSIKTVKDGQRVTLTFNLMTMNDWPTGATINAYAIDPDSARSALATSVDNHYMLRYGTLFASSFLQGMGQAVQDSGTTVSSDSGVVTQSTSSLDTQEQILVALGQVGQNASTEVAKLQNTPPTVKVKAGIGIGILFMSDVNAVKGAPTNAQNSIGLE